MAMLPLQSLRSPLDASRFLFSTLSTLHVELGLPESAPPTAAAPKLHT
jgi:hypothetical protein